jgi:ElaB/YqjD/DUF883 family membrane-anchored ribosome-binding protein
MAKPHVLLTLLLLGFLSAFACGKASRANDGRLTYYEKKEYTYDHRTEFRADMERAVDKLEARLQELRARADRAGDKARADTRELIDDVEARLPELRRNLAEAGDATKEGWQDFKRKFQQTFDDLGRRIDRAFD